VEVWGVEVWMESLAPVVEVARLGWVWTGGH